MPFYVNKKTKANPPGIYRKNWPGNASITRWRILCDVMKCDFCEREERERLFL